MKKSELKQLIKEEILKLREEQIKVGNGAFLKKTISFGNIKFPKGLYGEIIKVSPNKITLRFEGEHAGTAQFHPDEIKIHNKNLSESQLPSREEQIAFFKKMENRRKERKELMNKLGIK